MNLDEFTALSVRRLLAGIHRLLHQRNIRPPRQMPHRIHKRHAQVIPHEGNGIAPLCATEAVEALVRLVNIERRRPLRVERAQAQVIAPGLFQLNILANQIHDVRRSEDLAQGIFSNGGHSLGKGNAQTCPHSVLPATTQSRASPQIPDQVR